MTLEVRRRKTPVNSVSAPSSLPKLHPTAWSGFIATCCRATPPRQNLPPRPTPGMEELIHIFQLNYFYRFVIGGLKRHVEIHSRELVRLGHVAQSGSPRLVAIRSRKRRTAGPLRGRQLAQRLDRPGSRPVERSRGAAHWFGSF